MLYNKAVKQGGLLWQRKMKSQIQLSSCLNIFGNYRYLTIASWVLATISAFVALVPFYFIWRLIKEVLRVAPAYGNAQNLSVYGRVPLHLQ